MEEGLYNQILSHLKEGNEFNFDFYVFNASEGIQIETYSSSISPDLKESFIDWAYEGMYNLLVGHDLFNGGNFDFFISNNKLKINGRSSLDDTTGMEDSQYHKIDKLLDKDVLEVLFKKDSIDITDVDPVYLNFECEFDYLSGKTDFKMLDSSYSDKAGENKEFDLSSIDMTKLEDLICQRIKDLKNDYIQPNIKFNHDSKTISCQDSSIQVNDYISYELNIEKIKK
jgi:hypothetical protein